MTRRFLVRLPCMERRPAEAAVRFAWGAPERRNPVAAGASDRIGMRFACHRGGDRECIIGAVSSLRFPMRKLLILALVALMVSGCRSEEHTSELQSLMRISYAVFCLKK